MLKALITGSKGVVSSCLLRMLADRGHGVFGVDLNHDAGEVGWGADDGWSE